MAERAEYELTGAEAALLMAATKDAMGAAGELGGSLTYQFGAGRGGAAGGRFGARFTRPRSADAHVELPHDPAAVRERARASIAASGASAPPDARG